LTSERVVKQGTSEALIDERAAEALMAAALHTTRTPRGPSGNFHLSGFLFTSEGAALETAVLDQVNGERNGHTFADRFITNAKRATVLTAAPAAPAALEREQQRIAKRLAAWARLAEQEYPTAPQSSPNSAD
jgi:hypothetical protein